MRKKFSQRRITVVLNPPEEKIITQAEENGFNISEILREMIRKWGKEEFPPIPVYAQALKKKVELDEKKVSKQAEIDEMTNEEYATKVLGGQLRDNGKVAFRIGGGREIYFNLDTIKEYSEENNQEIKVHNMLLNRTFTYFGTPLSDSQWKDIWDGWEDGQPGFEQRKREGLPDITKKDVVEETTELVEKTPEEIEDELLNA